MGANPCFVQATVSGCVIYRETSGCYVVTRHDLPMKKVRVATLAGAYAACHGWEKLLSHPG